MTPLAGGGSKDYKTVYPPPPVSHKFRKNNNSGPEEKWEGVHPLAATNQRKFEIKEYAVVVCARTIPSEKV